MISAMKVRWYSTYNEHGEDSEITLQYWDTDAECWLDVNHIRCAEKDEHLYQGEAEY